MAGFTAEAVRGSWRAFLRGERALLVFPRGYLVLDHHDPRGIWWTPRDAELLGRREPR